MRLSIAIAAATIVAAVAVTGADARTRPLTSAHVSACQLSATSTDREATFVSTMDAVPGTSQMQMRFRLRQRLPGRPAAQVPSRALFAWRKSRTGVRSFTYTQTVNGLPPTSLYWMAIDYQWLDSAGRVIRAATRYSPVCNEVSPLNGVRILNVTAHAGAQPGTFAYDFDLANRGQDALRNLKLSLVVDRAAAGATQVAGLDPGQTQTVELTGPACARSVHLVVEREGDARRSVLGWHCPLAQ